MDKLKFLKATRFWALVLIAIVTYLGSVGILPADLVESLVTLLGGFIGIRTIDRGTEKIGLKK